MDTQQEKELIEDAYGKTSSKRVLGIKFMKVGLWFGLTFYIIDAMFRILHSFWPLKVQLLDMPFPQFFFLATIGVGASLLGITLFEGTAISTFLKKK